MDRKRLSVFITFKKGALENRISTKCFVLKLGTNLIKIHWQMKPRSRRIVSSIGSGFN